MADLDLGGRLAVMDTKLDILIEQRSDHEARIRALEKFKLLLVGAALAGGGVAGSIAAQILQ
jgi:hypothetical protein